MKQTATVTERTARTEQNFFSVFFFFFLTGVICVGVKPQRHDQLAKPPCCAPHENYPAVGKYKLKI